MSPDELTRKLLDLNREVTQARASLITYPDKFDELRASLVSPDLKDAVTDIQNHSTQLLVSLSTVCGELIEISRAMAADNMRFLTGISPKEGAK